MTTRAVPAPRTEAEALHYMLGIHCPSCRAVLPEPGLPCDACGKIPPVTAPAAREMLGSATAIAAVQEKVLEAEAEALYQAAMEKWQDAAQVLHIARLRDQLDAAQAALDEHNRKHGLKLAARTRAEKAEAAAAAELEPQAAAVAELAGAVELARDMRHGVKSVAQAVSLHATAEWELKPYLDDLASATAKYEHAEGQVTASGAHRDQLRKAKDDAEAELADPGMAPLGPAAIIASPFRLLREGKLDGNGPGLDIAGEAGRAICDGTGRTEEIVAEARGQLLAQQEAAARGKDLHLWGGRDGLTATANPHSAATPMPFHPPAQGNQPHPVQPATTPGWST